MEFANAQALGYACIGGQFQFRLADGTCEMYWLSADSDPRHEAELWLEYCDRSCSEVRTRFQKLLCETDFRKQALEWQSVREAMDHGLNPLEKLTFVAYFVDEAEWLEDERRRLRKANLDSRLLNLTILVTTYAPAYLT